MTHVTETMKYGLEEKKSLMENLDKNTRKI
jgi:hypothetical protein